MMISIERYYEENLKDKSVSQIMTKIRSLRKEIARLKKVLEHPDYECRQKPSELAQLSCNQQYLEKAKEIFIDAGGTYTPTKTEEKIAAFNERLAGISKVTFAIGGYLTDCETKVVIVAGNSLYLRTEKFCAFLNPPEVAYSYDVQRFINDLRSLNLGEWRKQYDTERYGIMVLDGTQWELCLSFHDGQPDVKFRGSNAYPYNFRKVQELFDALWTAGTVAGYTGTD